MVCIKKQPYIYYVRLTFKNRHFFRYLTCLLDRGHIITGGFDYVFYGDGEPSVSPFEHDEKLPQTFDPRTGTLKQDLTVSEYKALVMSHIDKISKKGEEYSRVKEVSVQRCIDDYKKMLKQKRTYEKLPNGLVLTVYANDGHIESRRTFKRLSSEEEAKGVKSGYDRDYEYALKYYNYSRHDGDYLIWR